MSSKERRTTIVKTTLHERKPKTNILSPKGGKMEKQLNLGLESPIKRKAEFDKPIQELLNKTSGKVKLKTLSLKAKPQTKDCLKREKLFDNRIHKLLSTKEASGLLGVSENALRILVCRKKIKAYKLGSRLKFRHSDLADCLQKKEV